MLTLLSILAFELRQAGLFLFVVAGEALLHVLQQTLCHVEVIALASICRSAGREKSHTAVASVFSRGILGQNSSLDR